MQMMILGHCKCAHHCFSVNCLPRGVTKLYYGKNEREHKENEFRLLRLEPEEDVVYSTPQH